MPDRDWKQGLQRIAPGVYADEAGAMHLDTAELLEANGYVANAENEAMVERVAKKLFRKLRIRWDQ